jgi:cytochrome c biogenesis protein CcmG/thiol:disulfide interchange protein DsbE
VAERLKAPVLKTGIPKGIEGSNPSLSSPSMKMLVVPRAAAFAVSVLLARPAFSEPNAEGASGGSGPASIGERRPALELDAIDGSFVNDARTKGRPLIIEFFATWCQPCHRALADVTEARKTAGNQVQLILVDLGERPDVVKRWAATANVPGNTIVAVDPGGSAARRWGARRLPTTFIVDARGVIRHINRGWGAGYRDRLQRWLGTIQAPAPSDPDPHPAPTAPASPATGEAR